MISLFNQQRHLCSAFQFSQEDLEVNKAGKLTEVQRERIREAQWKFAFTFIASGLVLSAIGLYLIFQEEF